MFSGRALRNSYDSWECDKCIIPGGAAANYAQRDAGNTFSASQTITSGSATALSVSSTGVGSSNTGVDATANGPDGTGIKGTANNGTLAYGVWGASSSGYAGYFSGNVNVTGTLSAGEKYFKIDDPLDPASKYLVHSSVESSELKTIYDGTVVLNARGEAVVRLPNWFEALNGDFR